MSMINIALLFAWGKPDLKPCWWPTSGWPCKAAACWPSDFHLHHHKNQIVAGASPFSLACCYGC